MCKSRNPLKCCEGRFEGKPCGWHPNGQNRRTPGLTRAARRRKNLRKEVREEVFRRDGYRCRECGTTERAKLTIDHIIPLAWNGTNLPGNLQVLCERCNNEKAWKERPNLPPDWRKIGVAEAKKRARQAEQDKAEARRRKHERWKARASLDSEAKS